MNRLHDITMTIKEGMVTYPGDPGVRLERVERIEDGSTANVSTYAFGSHTGTHIDPPFHFIPQGVTADGLPLGPLIGLARVVEAPVDEIGRDFLAGSGLIDCERILFKTKNSGFIDDPEFHADFAHLTEDGAIYLLEQGVKAVGIDYLSVEKYHSGTHAVHRRLLEGGVVIIEGLDLSKVGPGIYELICLPLKVKGGDGAPARAVLREVA